MINYKELYNLIKPECVTCSKQVCKNCNFVKGHNLQTGKLFKKIGVPLGLEKCKLFYFIYYPELNWKFPILPEYDFLNNNKHSKQFNWVIHHEDGNHHNDNKWNLILCLNTEHRHFHNLTNHPMKNIESRKKLSKTISNITQEKIKDGTHNFINNHPMKDPKIRQRTTNILLKKYKNGEVAPRKLSHQQTVLLKLLLKIPDGTYSMSSISTIINIKSFRDNYYLKNSILKLIDRENLNITIIDNGKTGGHKRWYIKKLKDNL